MEGNNIANELNSINQLLNQQNGGFGDAISNPSLPAGNNVQVGGNVTPMNTMMAVNEAYQEADNGMQESLDNMFAAVIVGGLDRSDMNKVTEKAEVFKRTLNLFLSRFMSNIFNNEYSFLYECLSTLKVKVFTPKQLETLIENNATEILGSPLIDLSAYTMNSTGGAATDQEKLEAFKYDVMDKYFYLSNKAVTVEEYESACNIFIAGYKDKLMLEIAQNMSMIMTTGYYEKKSGGRGVTYKGYEDAKKYYNKKIALINQLEEENYVRDIKVDEEWLEGEYQKDKGIDNDIMTKIGINEIDEVHGYLHRGNMIEFLGPPKGGKTTLATFLAEKLLAEGYNVAIWPLEGEVGEWTALIQSLMVRKSDNPMYIDKKRVYERNFESDEERQAVFAARQQLATDLNRGRLSFIDGVCYVETMVQTLQNHYDNVNAFDVIVMDSPVIVLSNTGKPRTDRVAEAFTLLKNFVSNKLRRKALAIVTAQLKQAVVDKLRANPKEEIDVTAGGESAETIRTPDYVVGVFSTKTERNLGQLKIHDVATRHGASFDSCYIKCELGCGYFASDPSLND